MTAYQDAHNADCEVCTAAISRPPQPFDDNLCHMDIRPGDGWDDSPGVQCPHLPVPGSPLRICEHHLEAAARLYAHVAARKAPFN